MSEEVKEQILEIRDSGKTNMLDIPMVERIAYEMKYFALVCFIEENRRDYINFIFNGEE